MQDEELTESEREAMRALPREAQPSDLLEERTVRALAGRGLLRSRRRVPASVAWIGAAAACVLFFVAGWSAGSARSDRSGDGAVVSPAGTEARGGNLAAAKGATEVGTEPGPADTAEQRSTGATALDRSRKSSGTSSAGPGGATTVTMDTVGGFALTGGQNESKAKTQIVVWF